MEDVLLGVTACPHCRRAQTVELRFDRVKCTGCGQTFRPRERRLYYEGDEASTVLAAHLRLSAQLQGAGIEEYAAILSSLERDHPKTLEDAMNALQRRSPEFSSEDLAQEFQRQGIPGDARQALARFMEENRIYEPRPNRYRFV